MSADSETRAEYYARMKVQGYRVDVPAANELFIDIDSEEAYSTFLRASDILIRETHDKFPEGIIKEGWSETGSKSGYPHQHIRVKLTRDISDWERIALQAALGSDPIREIMSITRLYNDDLPVTTFAEKDDGKS